MDMAPGISEWPGHSTTCRYLVLVNTGNSAIIALRETEASINEVRKGLGQNKWISLSVINVSENQGRCCLSSPPMTSAHVE